MLIDPGNKIPVVIILLYISTNTSESDHIIFEIENTNLEKFCFGILLS